MSGACAKAHQWPVALALLGSMDQADLISCVVTHVELTEIKHEHQGKATNLLGKTCARYTYRYTAFRRTQTP